MPAGTVSLTIIPAPRRLIADLAAPEPDGTEEADQALAEGRARGSQRPLALPGRGIRLRGTSGLYAKAFPWQTKGLEKPHSPPPPTAT